MHDFLPRFGETFRVKGTGTLEIRLGNVTSKAAATMEFSASALANQTIEVNPELFKGVKNLCFVFTAAENVQFDAWQFSVYPTGIASNSTSSSSSRQYHDLSGRFLPNGGHQRQIVIEQYTDRQGQKHTRKLLRTQ